MSKVITTELQLRRLLEEFVEGQSDQPSLEPIRRLCVLLAMSPGERAFVTADVLPEAMAEVRRVLEEVRQSIIATRHESIGEDRTMDEDGRIITRHTTRVSASCAFLEPIRRLCALLSMSPGERAFVAAIADAVAAGQPMEAWDQLAIFADWVEENLNAGEGHPIRLLRPRSGDVLVMQYPRSTGAYDHERDAAKAVLDHQIKALAERGIADVRGIGLSDGWTLETVSSEMMHAAGWVRVEEAQRMVREETLACAQVARDEASKQYAKGLSKFFVQRGEAKDQVAKALEDRHRQMEAQQQEDPPT